MRWFFNFGAGIIRPHLFHNVESMLYLLSVAFLLGGSAGLAPGPLLTLVISETVRHGTTSGIRAAIAPLITDAPIVLAAWFILSRFANSDPILGTISVIGGLVVLYLALGNFRVGEFAVDAPARQNPASLAKGVVVNFLNPQPYLFWLSVGAPMLVEAAAYSIAFAVLFLLVFYGLLVGLKVLIAILIGRYRQRFNFRIYRGISMVLGVVLTGFGLQLLWQGAQLLGLM